MLNLNQPHPFYEQPKDVLLRLLVISGLVIFILLIFQPFGTAEFQHPYKHIFLTGYGVIAFIAFSIVFLLLPKLVPYQFTEEKWVVWKHILLFLAALLLTFSSSYFYLNWFFESTLNWKEFLGFCGISLSIGILPSIIIPLLDNNLKLKNHQKVAEDINAELPKKNDAVTILSFSDENGKAVFQLDSNQLMYIQSANNYVEIHYSSEGKMQKQLLRNSLSNIEQQLNFPNIKRCHRSYLVNLDQVNKITGNAQGYKLHFAWISALTIPVSRSKGKDLLRFFQK